MSSAHLIVVARNTRTGEIAFPLGDMTLYGTGEEGSILDAVSRIFTGEWAISIYGPRGEDRSGTKNEAYGKELDS